MRGFRYHIALLTMLLSAGCTAVDNPVFEPKQGKDFFSQTYFQGKVAHLASWTFLSEGEGKARWDVVEHVEKSFDEYGRVVEAKEWRNGNPHGHVWNGFDAKGRIIISDKRLVNGKTGPLYRYSYEGNGFRALKTSADGIVLEKEERTYDAKGELSTADRIQYPHPVWEQGKEIVRTAEGACGNNGDTLFFCNWRQGRLTQRLARVEGRLKEKMGYGEDGMLTAIGRWVDWKDTEAWETTDTNGNLLRRDYMVTISTGDTAEVQHWEVFEQDGQMVSMQLQFINAHGKVFLEQVYEQFEGNPGLRLARERLTFWHFNTSGNVVKEITFEEGRCVRMRVFAYEYREEK